MHETWEDLDLTRLRRFSWEAGQNIASSVDLSVLGQPSRQDAKTRAT